MRWPCGFALMRRKTKLADPDFGRKDMLERNSLSDTSIIVLSGHRGVFFLESLSQKRKDRKPQSSLSSLSETNSSPGRLTLGVERCSFWCLASCQVRTVSFWECRIPVLAVLFQVIPFLLAIAVPSDRPH